MPQNDAGNPRRPWWDYWWVRVIITVVAIILFAGIGTAVGQALGILT